MRFCFYSGYKDIKGGHTTLLITLIKGLINQGQDVILFNYANGLISKELGSLTEKMSIVDLNSVTKKNIKDHIDSEDIFVVTQFIEFFAILFKANPRVIYYDINDFITRISDYKFGIRLPFLGKNLVKRLLETKSLIFMDGTGILNLERDFSIKVDNPRYLPIPVCIPEHNKYISKFKLIPNELNITYIGRSVDWKMMPLKKLMNDCVQIEGIKFKFFVVVDNLINFYKYIDIEYFSNCKNIEIEVIENMLPSQIENFLLSHSDIHFGMGTSALDGSKLGIPTILLDYSSKEFPDDYTYRWIYESSDFSLGCNLEKVSAKKGISLQELINNFFLNTDIIYNESEKAYEYTFLNHGEQSIAAQLIGICQKSEFRFKDARNLVPYYFKPHLWSKYLLNMKNKRIK